MHCINRQCFLLKGRINDQFFHKLESFLNFYGLPFKINDPYLFYLRYILTFIQLLKKKHFLLMTIQFGKLALYFKNMVFTKLLICYFSNAKLFFPKQFPLLLFLVRIKLTLVKTSTWGMNFTARGHLAL